MSSGKLEPEESSVLCGGVQSKVSDRVTREFFIVAHLERDRLHIPGRTAPLAACSRHSQALSPGAGSGPSCNDRSI